MRRATVLTIAGTVFVILLTDLFSIFKIQNKGSRRMTPMDQVIWRTNLLEASLMGAVLEFLSKKLRLEREKLQPKEKEEKSAAEVKRLQKEISGLTANLKKLKLKSTEKDKQVETAESHVTTLQKQAADLLLEYDRILEDNHNLQNQVLGYQS